MYDHMIMCVCVCVCVCVCMYVCQEISLIRFSEVFCKVCVVNLSNVFS